MRKVLALFVLLILTTSSRTASGGAAAECNPSACHPLDPAWSSADVGPAATPGNAQQLANTFLVDGAGADIWGTADAFRFVFRPVIDDAQISARVVSQTATHRFAKAGVMLRASVDPGSFAAILDEFRQRYLLSYSPTGVAAEGWHRIDVTVRRPDVLVKARTGYLARQ